MELVPCDRRNISRLIFNYEVAGWSLDKLCSRPWGLRGRSPLDNNYDYLNNNNAAGDDDDDDDDEEEEGKKKKRKRPRPPPVSVVVSPAYKKQKYTKRKQQKPKPNLDHIILPPLTQQQQQYYSRRELVEIVLQTPKGSKDRTDTISKIMELKRVPCDRRNVQRIIFNYEENKMSMDKLDRPWGLRGRIALLDDDEIASIARDVQTKPGLNVETAILDHIKKNLQAQGIDTTSTNKEDWMPNSTTLRNYKALIGSQPNVNVKRTGLAIRK